MTEAVLITQPVFMSFCGNIFQYCNLTNVQETAMKLYRCVVEIKMKSEGGCGLCKGCVGSREGAIGPSHDASRPHLF